MVMQNIFNVPLTPVQIEGLCRIGIGHYAEVIPYTTSTIASASASPLFTV